MSTATVSARALAWSRVFQGFTDELAPHVWPHQVARTVIADWQARALWADKGARSFSLLCAGQLLQDTEQPILYAPSAVDLLTFNGVPHGYAHALTVIDQLVHVRQEHYRGVLRKYASLVAPNGLLFLAEAYWNCEGPDTTKSTATRQRIFNQGSWDAVRKHLSAEGFQMYGIADWRYPDVAPIDGDHTYATLAMVKTK